MTATQTLPAVGSLQLDARVRLSGVPRLEHSQLEGVPHRRVACEPVVACEPDSENAVVRHRRKQ